ncbi:MAG TPA: universal stress protein [Nitrososphaeraceae archaeon]|jgi:nucleotide-binding universal stress UspA family protein
MSNKKFSILVAVDGSDSSIKALDYAIELAKKQDNPHLILLNILEIEAVKKMASSFIVAPTYGLKEYEEHKKAVLETLDGFKSRCEGERIPAKLEVIGGPAQTTSSIVNYAEDENVDLIVVGTRGNSGLKKLLLGSVASGVVTYAHCPVLVVK